MLGQYILGEDGRTPIPCEDIVTWGQQHELRRSGDVDPWRVARTDLPNGVYVSTVFLSIDHNFGNGPPLLFETMIFGGEHNEYCERFATWAEAEAGHEIAVRIAQSEPAPSA